MRKNYLKYSITAALMASSLLFTGCGSGSSSASYAEASDYADYEGLNSDYEYDDASYSEDMEDETASDKGSVASDGSDYSQKLVYTYSYSFETTDFDASMDLITEKVSEYGGYIQYSNTYGSYSRESYMVVRIPQARSQAFLAQTGSIGELTSREISTEDISLEYYDVSARLESLQAQHTRLLELMEKAEDLADIAQLESKLSDVEYDINSYQTQLNVYNNQVDYVTIYIDLYEVNQVGVAEDDSFLTRIQKGLASNTADLEDFLVNLLVWLIIMIPYFAVIAVIVVIILLITRGSRRKIAAKKAAKLASELLPPPADESDSE